MRYIPKIHCIYCHRDLNEIYQVNMSDEVGQPICEDCHKKYHGTQQNNERRFLSKKQFKFLMKYAGWHYMRVKNTDYDKAIRKIEQITYMMRKNKEQL